MCACNVRVFVCVYMCVCVCARVRVCVRVWCSVLAEGLVAEGVTSTGKG